ncbi:MAG: c-type cytochrome, partial [Myxococcales bacterium]|nr:c-type cytochrome [Myxococcales bacterium]
MIRELLWLTSALLLSAPGCAERFDEPQLLGGILVQPEVLNRGMQLFRRDCAGCHGDDGKGKRATNPAERGPRDLTLGYYKFTSVPGGRLPTDDDLARTIREGLDGTQMVARPELSAADLHALVQYLKTLSPRWRNENTGTPITTDPDPWGVGRRQDAIARGFVVYHGLAQCWSCHPSYVPLDRLANLASEALPPGAESIDKAIQFRGDTQKSRVVETVYGDVLPPDFLDDRV